MENYKITKVKENIGKGKKKSKTVVEKNHERDRPIKAAASFARVRRYCLTAVNRICHLLFPARGTGATNELPSPARFGLTCYRAGRPFFILFFNIMFFIFASLKLLVISKQFVNLKYVHDFDFLLDLQKTFTKFKIVPVFPKVSQVKKSI